MPFSFPKAYAEQALKEVVSGGANRKCVILFNRRDLIFKMYDRDSVVLVSSILFHSNGSSTK